VLLVVHLDDAGARYPHHEHVRLLVDVLADAPSRREPHQVGVEIAELLQGPNRPSLPSGGGQALAEVHYVCLTHPGEILAHMPAENAGSSFALPLEHRTASIRVPVSFARQKPF
jgi:hypothetical protein